MSPEFRRSDGLHGLNLLAVEDDFLLLLDLEEVLLEAGARSVITCRTLDEAIAAADNKNIDAAVLDMRIGQNLVTPVAARLAARGTPFVFYTGQRARDHELKQWSGVKVIAKPAAPEVIVDAVAESVRARG